MARRGSRYVEPLVGSSPRSVLFPWRKARYRPIRDQVKQTLKHLLAGQRPAIQEVARELNLSARTLQRRLTEAGVTFQQVLEEARRELARHYLLQASLDLNETAYLLGYENANSFFRAFHHWEGTSPGQRRNFQQRANGEALAMRRL